MSPRGVLYPDERIIEAIQEWVREHGDTPRNDEWSRAGPGHPSAHVLKNHFGTFNKAIEAAGFAPREVGNKTSRRWTQTDILDAIRKFTRERGRPPTGSELVATHPFLPSKGVVVNRFGTLNAAFQAAGYKPRPCGVTVKWSDRGPDEFMGWTFDNREGKRAEVKEQKRNQGG